MTAIEVPLKQISAGFYQAQTPVSAPGIYLARLGVNDGDRSLGQETLGLVVPYSPEYKISGIDQSFLARLAALTGGGEISPDTPEAAFTRNLPSLPSARAIWLQLLILVALLFPFDVSLRRVSVGRKEIVEALDWLKSRWSASRQTPANQPRLLTDLFAARQRARRPSRETDAAQGGFLSEKPRPQKTSTPANAQPDPAPTDVESPPLPRSTEQDSLARLRQAKKRAHKK